MWSRLPCPANWCGHLARIETTAVTADNPAPQAGFHGLDPERIRAWLVQMLTHALLRPAEGGWPRPVRAAGHLR